MKRSLMFKYFKPDFYKYFKKILYYNIIMYYIIELINSANMIIYNSTYSAHFLLNVLILISQKCQWKVNTNFFDNYFLL